MSFVDHDVSVVDRAGRVRASRGAVPRRPPQSQVQAYYRLIWLRGGELTIEADGRPYPVPPGEVALLVPGRHVRLAFSPTPASHHAWLTIERPPLAEAQLAGLAGAPPSLPVSRGMAALFDAADAASPLPAGAARCVLVPAVTAALALYLEEARLSGRPTGRGRGEHLAVAAAREAIAQRLHHPLTLGDLADAAHVAPAHLVRLFRREMKTTPFGYLWAERVRAGVYLLQQTDLAIGEVAARTGFRTGQHFSRLVKSLTGRTPTELRSPAVGRPQTLPVHPPASRLG